MLYLLCYRIDIAKKGRLVATDSETPILIQILHALKPIAPELAIWLF
jgi:hypothetical protein